MTRTHRAVKEHAARVHQPMRRLFISLLLGLLLFAATAAVAATPRAGRWSGKLTGSHDGKVSFKVSKSKKKLTRFEIPTVVVVCGLDIRTITVGVPSARIRKSGRFRRTYTLKGDDGSTEAVYTLTGRFRSRTRASGQVNVDTSSCNVDIKFRARRRR